MRCLYILLPILGISLQAFGQMSLSINYAVSYREMSPNKLVNENKILGVQVKKPIGLSWTLGVGLGYKNITARVTDYINDSDFRSKYPSLKPSKSVTHGFNFVSLPFSAEFAVRPGLRLRYMYHVNWLFEANTYHLEHGGESAKRFSGNHDFAVLILNPVTQGHIIIGVLTQPQLLNRKLSYSYEFTPAFYNKFGGALSIYLGLNLESNARPRKRDIL